MPTYCSSKHSTTSAQLNATHDRALRCWCEVEHCCASCKPRRQDHLRRPHRYPNMTSTVAVAAVYTCDCTYCINEPANARSVRYERQQRVSAAWGCTFCRCRQPGCCQQRPQGLQLRGIPCTQQHSRSAGGCWQGTRDVRLASHLKHLHTQGSHW